jgi:hypothetical protein
VLEELKFVAGRLASGVANLDWIAIGEVAVGIERK